MNVSATYNNVPQSTYDKLVLFIWSRGGLVGVTDNNVTLLAEDKIFYKLHAECQALLLGDDTDTSKGPVTERKRYY